MEVSDQFHTLAALPLEMDFLVWIGDEAGWAPEPVWMLWRRIKSYPNQKMNPGLPAHSLLLY
jgi:hypothetical protein